MSLKPVLSIVGIQRWYKGETGESIFKDMTIPETVDRDILANNILLECEGLTVIYTDPLFFKDALDIWSEKMNVKWAKIAETLALEYDPLENYRRNELETYAGEKTGGTIKNTSGSRRSTSESEDERTENRSDAVNSTNNSESVNKVNGMNSPTSLSLTDHDKNETSAGASSHSSGTTGNKGNSSFVGSEATGGTENENRSETDKNNRSLLVFGNAGTLTNQAMLISELDIRDKWFIYDMIINDFKKQFCILVY